MKKICGWLEGEVKEFFKFVEGKTIAPLKSVFSEYAFLSGRSPESVRNFYYAAIKTLRESGNTRFTLPAQVNTGKVFSDSEELALVENVIKGQGEGKSVRSVCDQLANNDLKETTRLQNKYRNMLTKNPDLIERARSSLYGGGAGVEKKRFGELESLGKAYASLGQTQGCLGGGILSKAHINSGEGQVNMDSLRAKLSRPQSDTGRGAITDRVHVRNVLKMPLQQSSKLTDGEIKSLFLGLVRLVKSSAAEEVSLELKRECEFANSTLRNTLIDLRRKDIHMAGLKEQNSVLVTQVKQLSDSLAKVRSENLDFKLKVENYATSEKMDKLRTFLSGLKKPAETVGV